MSGKTDFKDFADAQRYLYSIALKLEKNEITPAQAGAMSKVVDIWARVHKLKTNADILRRIDGLEEMYKKGAVRV